MGRTKNEIFSAEQNALSELMKAIAHPARIAILEYICKQEGCICNDIVDEVGLAQATISQHLKELKKVGLINGTVTGKKQCYCINTEKWNTAKKRMLTFFNNTPKKYC